MDGENRPAPQEIYRHFKGKLYQILTIAIHSESGEELVVYQALYGEYKIYCRPLESFCSRVDRQKYPEAGQVYRFERVMPEEAESDHVNNPGGRETAGALNEVERAVPDDGFSVPEEAAGVKNGVMSKTIEEEARELNMDPLVVRFLDADNASERIRVLDMLRGSATNDMIDIMAMSAGFDIEEGEPWERFGELRECLRTVERFETNRLR